MGVSAEVASLTKICYNFDKMIRKASGKEIDSGSSDSDVEYLAYSSEVRMPDRTVRGT